MRWNASTHALGKSWAWFWVFPQDRISVDPRSSTVRSPLDALPQRVSADGVAAGRGALPQGGQPAVAASAGATRPPASARR